MHSAQQPHDVHSPALDDRVVELIGWVLVEAVQSDDALGLLSALLDKMREIGIPVCYLGLSMATIDPLQRGMSFVCRHDRPPVIEALPYDQAGREIFEQGAVYFALLRQMTRCRWRLDTEIYDDQPEALAAFRADHATDFVLRLVNFPHLGKNGDGVAFSFVTDQPGGFEDFHIEVLDRLVPALGLAGRVISLSRTVHEALSVYLGKRTAQRVLSGDIRRGQGQTISAVVMIADLRGFTTVSEREDALRVVHWLDEHLEAIGAAVDQSGGEVLKFLGDGLLAIFPFGDELVSPEDVCEGAIVAAELALSKTADINAGRAARGEPSLELGIALHSGEVVYGNVGASRRLDFTVIGSTVNEASRIQGLCSQLGRSLLMSSAFATLCSRATTNLGNFNLRGLESGRTICVLDECRYEEGAIPSSI